MKRIFILCATLMMVAICGTTAQAQEESAPKKNGTWTTSTTPTLKLDQHHYDNWSASGVSSFSVSALFFGNYKYSTDKYIWDNVVDLGYGFTYQDLDGDTTAKGFKRYDSHRKGIDKIDLTSTFSMRMTKYWNVNASANLKSQFDKGYNYNSIADSDRVFVSRFFAPAYLTTALGFEYKRDNYNLTLSFLTGKTTFNLDDSLIANGYDYGVLKGRSYDYYVNNNLSIPHAYFGLGSYVKFWYKKDIAKNLNLYFRAELFYDYLKPGNMHWGEISNVPGDEYFVENYDELSGKNWLGKRAWETDIDLELKLDYRFSNWLSANLGVMTKWDTDYSGKGTLGHWQLYETFGLQIYWNWKTPKE